MAEEPEKPQDFTEHTLKSEIVHDAGFMQLLHDQVRLPDGSTGTRYVVRHAGAVAVVALTSDEQIVLVRQYRYPIASHSLEIPAGKLETGEEPLACAKRELLEETGCLASSWFSFLDTHTSVGYSSERITMFVAIDAHKVQEVSPDPGEFVEPVSMRLEAAWELMKRGEITENRTLLALMWLRQRMRDPDFIKLREENG